MSKRRVPNDKRVGAEDIARRYGVTPMTIYRMRRKGTIPAIKVGGQYRFDVEEVERVLREQNKLDIAAGALTA